MEKKYFLIIITFLSYISVFGQIGIPTINPRGILDLNNDAGTNNYGLVLPTINLRGILDLNNDAGTNNYGLVLPENITASISNPMGGSIAFGTLIFDTTENCVKYYSRVKNGWSECIIAKPAN